MEQIDRKYFDSICENYEGLIRRLVRHSEIIDEHGAIPKLRDEQVLYLSNHRSHFDYLQQMYNIWQRKLPVPRIAARENVFIPVLGKVWEKCGAFKLPFNTSKISNLRPLKKCITQIIENGESLFIYPEGGRSYDGKIQPFQRGTIDLAYKVAKKSNRNIIVAPRHISYHPSPIEQRFFSALKVFKGRFDNVPYVSIDLAAFAWSFVRPRKSVLDVFGKPFSLLECKNGREVCSRAREQILEIRRKYRKN